MRDRGIVIAGAGIAGLTLALALARHGIGSTVLERAAGPTFTGAGIQLSPNASRLLLNLGLGDRLAPVAGEPEALRVLGSRRARPIAEMPLGAAISARYGAPYWVLHRGDLAAVLMDGVHDTGLVDLRFGTAIRDMDDMVQGVRIATDDGDISAKALIGADGVRSRVRGLVRADASARFSGRVAFRGLLPSEAAPEPWMRDRTGLWLGRSAHLVHYPVRAGREINVVAIVDGGRDLDQWDEAVTAEEALGPFSAWPASLRQLLGAVPDWRRYGLATVDAAGSYATRNIALVGDAAHAMLPFAAQGGGMAIEDATVLARLLAEDRPVAEAFAAYQALRRPRAAAVAALAERNGRIYHLGAAAAARDLALRLLGGAGMLRRMDWIYGWRDAPGTDGGARTRMAKAEGF